MAPYIAVTLYSVLQKSTVNSTRFGFAVADFLETAKSRKLLFLFWAISCGKIEACLPVTDDFRELKKKTFTMDVHH